MARSAALADAPVHVVVTVDPQASKSEIATDAEGLSYESAVLQPDRKGGHYFSPRNTTLIRLFRTIGVKSLRLGGVTVDLPNLFITQADIDELFEFARAADVKVIYSFRLKDGDIQAIKPLARHILNRYAANLDCIAIGNEPNEFMANYAMFEKAWMPFLDAISQENPGMKFCGPSAWKEDWARQFAIEISDERAKRIAFVAQHEYAYSNAGCITGSKNPAITPMGAGRMSATLMPRRCGRWTISTGGARTIPWASTSTPATASTTRRSRPRLTDMKSARCLTACSPSVSADTADSSQRKPRCLESPFR
jgi:hypothetical protein